MHEQHHGPIFGALIDVGNAQAADFNVMRGERKVWQVLKSLFGCAKKFFNVRVLAHGDVNL
jgi:hypothetical protein